MVLRKIGVLSAAKISGVLYAAIGLLTGLMFAGLATFMSSMSSMGQSPEPAVSVPFFGALFGVGSIIILPIVYAIMGFVGGAIGAVIYNVFAGIVGGLELHLEPSTRV